MAVKDDLVAKVFLAVENLSEAKKKNYTEINKAIATAVKTFIEDRLTLTGNFVGLVPSPNGAITDPLSGPKVYMIDDVPLKESDLNSCANIQAPVGAAGQKWISVIEQAIKQTKFSKTDKLQTMSALSSAPNLSLNVTYQNPVPTPDVSLANAGMPIPGLPNDIYIKTAKFGTELQKPEIRQATLEKMKNSIPNRNDGWYNEARILMYGTYDIIFARVITSINTVFTFPSPVMSAMSKSPGSTGAITWIKTVWIDV